MEERTEKYMREIEDRMAIEKMQEEKREARRQNNEKRKEFVGKLRKSVATIGMIGALGIGGPVLAKVNADSKDISEYNIDNNKYVDYIKGSDSKKIEKLEELDENISRYKELKDKSIISKEESAERDELRENLMKEMKSGELADFYLNDLFKEKLKKVYNAKDIETHFDHDTGISIKFYDEHFQTTYMDKKDQIKPIVVAMNDIAKLQGYEGKDEFSNYDLADFMNIHENMKAFANIDFIKVQGQPLACAEIQKDKVEDEGR